MAADLDLAPDPRRRRRLLEPKRRRVSPGRRGIGSGDGAHINMSHAGREPVPRLELRERIEIGDRVFTGDGPRGSAKKRRRHASKGHEAKFHGAPWSGLAGTLNRQPAPTPVWLAIRKPPRAILEALPAICQFLTNQLFMWPPSFPAPSNSSARPPKPQSRGTRA